MNGISRPIWFALVQFKKPPGKIIKDMNPESEVRTPNWLNKFDRVENSGNRSEVYQRAFDPE